jgi:hypothetical protein
VILYVSVTAVLNIALGFALAMYLHRAGLLVSPRAALATTEPHHIEEATHEQALHAEPSPVAEAIAPANQEPVAAAPALLAAEPDTAAAPAGPELEENVLAGIEEFRNQLAQMKSQPADATEAAPI